MSAEEAQQKVEEVVEETPAQETPAEETPAQVEEKGVESGAGVTIYSRNEKKARKLIAKLNLKPVEGISRVTFVNSRQIVFAISNPDVYKTASGSYVVFGEAKAENLNARAQAAQRMAEQARAAGAAGALDEEINKSPESITADLEKASLEADKPAEEAAEDLDAGDISEDDIKLVCEQANVSRGKAIAAIKKNNGDIVNSIMELAA